MIDEHDHDDDDDHGPHEAFELELNTQTQFILDMRQQNLDLLEIAARVVGYGEGQNPLKPGDVREALKSIWEVYSEFYSWIDPEEPGDDEEDEE